MDHAQSSSIRHYLGRFPSKILSISISMKILKVICEGRRPDDQYSGTAPVFRHCLEVGAGSLAKTVSQDSEAGIYFRLALIMIRLVEKFPCGVMTLYSMDRQRNWCIDEDL